MDLTKPQTVDNLIEYIKEHSDKVYWYWISQFQKLSKSFRAEKGIEIYEDSWLYAEDSFHYI